MARTPAFAGRVVTFGTAARADIRATQIEELGVEGTRRDVRTPDGEADLRVPLLGLGNLQNVLAATAVAAWHGVPLDDVVERAAAVRPADTVAKSCDCAAAWPSWTIPTTRAPPHSSGRSRPSAGIGAGATGGGARRDARARCVCPALHGECGHAAPSKAGIDVLVAVGGQAAAALGRRCRRVPAWTRMRPCTSQRALRPRTCCLPRSAPGDLVLVKGSRGIGTDLVVERVKAEWG